MKKRMTIILGMLFLLPLLSYTSVSAQYMFSTNPYNNPLNNMLTTMINGKINEEMLRQSVANQKGRSSPKSTTAQSTAHSRSAAEISKVVSFRPTATPLKVREIANLLGSTVEEKEQLFTLFSQFLTYFEADAKRLGKPNDFPLALSVFLAVNSSVYHGTPDPDDAHLMKLRDIIAGAMVEDPHYAAVTDRSKQELYETMIIFTLLTQGSISEAKKAGDQNMMNGYRKFAGMNLQNFCKASPDTLTF
jgi:hypothetical protein